MEFRSYTFTSRQKLDLAYELLRTSFKLRYNDSALGIVWVLLKPLLSFTVLFIVFSYFRDLSVKSFQIYLLIGIIFYNFFSESVMFGMNGLLDKAHIILKVNFPKEVAIIASQGLAVINVAINLVILIVFSLFNEVNPTIISLLYFLFNIVVVSIMTFSISQFLSIMTVKLRDLRTIMEVVLQMGFYLTPIFYPISIVPEKFRIFIESNPMTSIIQASREAIISGEVILWKQNLITLTLSVLLLLLGRVYFKRNVKRIAEFY